MPPLPIEFFVQHSPALLELLGELVRIESPTLNKAAVDRLGERIAREARDLGAEVTAVPESQAGDHLVCRWNGADSTNSSILVLCHMDTVFELGTLAANPFREEGGTLRGPGVLDMKGGIALFLAVARLLRGQGRWPARPLTALFTSDEETGSLTSRALIEAEARRAAIVFCLEPGMADGALKTARKGTGDIELRARGVAAHAGAAHEQGRNAIEELAHHILSAQKLTDYAKGTTVNVGVVRGGTRSNVVPDEASAEVDFRIAEPGEAARLQAWAGSLKPVISGASVEAVVSLNRPPMPRDETMARTFTRAQAIAAGLGLALSEGSTGGASDANFVAPLGVPVLDGLGLVGEWAHSEREFVRVESIPQRAALLAALLMEW